MPPVHAVVTRLRFKLSFRQIAWFLAQRSLQTVIKVLKNP
jgi:hypothetical protein